MRARSFLAIRGKMLRGKFRVGNIAVWTKHFIRESVNMVMNGFVV
jgi:hypothetical protein